MKPDKANTALGKLPPQMGLSHFERRLERLVESVFAKTMRSGLQPVELGRRLAREMDSARSVGLRGTIVPNHYAIALATEDFERFSSFQDALAQDLSELAREHARDEGYVFVGPVTVTFEEDSSLTPGDFLVGSSLQEHAGGGPVGALVFGDGRRVQIGPEGVTIGRYSDCDIVLDDKTVSKHHAKVRREGSGFVLADLSSTNGTKVNGAGVNERRLEDGDVVTVGTTSLTFQAS